MHGKFLFPLPCALFASFLHIHPRQTQLFVYRLGNFVGTRWHGPLRHRQIADDFSLTLASNFTIAQKCCQNFLMSNVLAPRFELFRCLADFFTELGSPGGASKVGLTENDPQVVKDLPPKEED